MAQLLQMLATKPQDLFAPQDPRGAVHIHTSKPVY